MKTNLKNLKLAAISGIVILIAIILISLYWVYSGYVSATFVSATITAMLVLVTAISVTFNVLLLDDNRKSRNQAVKPDIIVDLESTALADKGVVISNIGNGTAKHVEIDLALYPQEIEWDFKEQKISVGEKIPAFAPEDITFQEDTEDKFDEITIKGSCEDIYGNEIPVEDEFEVTNLENTSNKDNLPYESDISDELHKISETLESNRR